MDKSGDVFLLQEADITGGGWATSLHQFQGLNLFKASNATFFCDVGPHQRISPEAIQITGSSYVMTLVGTDITYQNLVEVFARLQADQFQLIAVKTLSLSPVAVEIYFDLPDSSVLDQVWWEGWLIFTDANKVDIGLKPASHQGKRVRLACFDMDSTLIQAEVIDELAAEAGLMAEVSAITESAMRGELDFQQSFTKRLGMLKGLPESSVSAVLKRIQLMDGAKKLFAELRERGVYTAILSGGFDVFACQVQQTLDIQEVHANALNFVSGELTGEAVLPIMDAERKEASLRELAEKLHIPMTQTLAVGDGANDLLMLDAAGIGVAFRAKPKVQASARMVIRHGDLTRVLYFLGFSD